MKNDGEKYRLRTIFLHNNILLLWRTLLEYTVRLHDFVFYIILFFLIYALYTENKLGVREKNNPDERVWRVGV